MLLRQRWRGEAYSIDIANSNHDCGVLALAWRFGNTAWRTGVWSGVGRLVVSMGEIEGILEILDLVGGLVAKQRWGKLGLWKSWQM
jgi:hypothetical protein